jgi:hypothetical protein
MSVEGGKMSELSEATDGANNADFSRAFDYLTTAPDAPVLKNLSKMGEHLKELKLKMLSAETAYNEAKKEHDYYASSVLPMEMFNLGISELKLMSGGTLTYERKFYCQPNKNDADKKIMADWLRDHGGEDLVKEKAQVDAAKIADLKAAGIPYTEIDDINTNSLKAFLKDKIGAAGGQVQIQVTDIPACMHFQEVGLVSIDV